MNWLKKVLRAIQTILKVLFPKNRIANLVYLIIGFILSQWDPIARLIEKIVELF